MAPTETLHSHTVLSDGDMTHLEVLDTAQKYGVGIVAFTDHDILPSTEALQQLEKHRDHPVKWIVGVELTSKLPKELGDRPLNGLHIIGLFTDPTNEPLLAYCKAVRTSRLESIEKMVKNLQGLGFTLTVDDCRGFTKGQTLTRQHVAKALLSHAENMPVLDTYREQLRQAAASDKHLRGRYERMLDSEKNLGTREQDVYALFMGYNDAFVKGINVDYAHMADLDAVVSLIRGAGGLAILAHYHTILDKLPWDFLEKLFAENRLDGAEVVMGLHRSMSGKSDLIKEVSERLAGLIVQYAKLASGCVDAHNEEDFAQFQMFAEYSNRTLGLTDALVKHSGVSTRWSSLPPA